MSLTDIPEFRPVNTHINGEVVKKSLEDMDARTLASLLGECRQFFPRARTMMAWSWPTSTTESPRR